MVLFAGLFQIISYALDQGAIQVDEKVREYQYQMVSVSENRSAYLRMNNRVGTFLKVFEDVIMFSKASNFDDNTLRFLYFSIIFDQTRLLEDILNDNIVKEDFKNKEILIDKKKIKYIEAFNKIINFNHNLSTEIEKDPNLSTDYILYNVTYNNEYLNDMIIDLGDQGDKTVKKLKILTKNVSEIQLLKQKLLLTSVTTQLISLLFLLVLFRNISKNLKE
tara:strand:+ start:2161 stop:2820 length:660 start_codon:yes stop_codon:yes gene_type:complete